MPLHLLSTINHKLWGVLIFPFYVSRTIQIGLQKRLSELAQFGLMHPVYS